MNMKMSSCYLRLRLQGGILWQKKFSFQNFFFLSRFYFFVSYFLRIVNRKVNKEEFQRIFAGSHVNIVCQARYSNPITIHDLNKIPAGCLS